MKYKNILPNVKNILPYHKNNLPKEGGKVYPQSPCTPINEIVSSSFFEFKISRSLITQQDIS